MKRTASIGPTRWHELDDAVKILVIGELWPKTFEKIRNILAIADGVVELEGEFRFPYSDPINGRVEGRLKCVLFDDRREIEVRIAVARGWVHFLLNDTQRLSTTASGNPDCPRLWELHPWDLANILEKKLKR